MAERNNPIRFECEVTWDDLSRVDESRAVGTGWKHRWFREYSWRVCLLGFLMCAGATLLLFALIRTWLSLLAGAAVFGFIGITWAFAGSRNRWATWDKGVKEFRASAMASNLVGTHELEFDDEGVTRRTQTTVAWRPWGTIGVADEAGGLTITCDTELWRLPPAVFPGDQERQSLFKHLVGLKQSAGQPATRIAEGDIVSPVFDLCASHLHGAWALGVRPWAPKPKEIALAGLNIYIAAAFWPWWERPVAWVGLSAALTAIWTLLGSRLYERWRFRKNALRQTRDDAILASFKGITLGFGPAGLTEASPVCWNLDTWPAIWEVVVNENATLFRTTSARIYILPASAFPDSDSYFDFVEEALSYRRAALQQQAA